MVVCNLQVYTLRTSTIAVTEVGETPQVAEADGIAEAGQQEVQFARPVPALRVLVRAHVRRRRIAALALIHRLRIRLRL